MTTPSRLPAPGWAGALLASPMTRPLTWPWFDRVVLRALAAGYFPLSRVWAAAAAADGSIERFLNEVPLARLPAGAERGVARALGRVAERQAAAEAAHRRWQEALFGPSVVASSSGLVAAELERRRASHAFMMARFAFAGLRLRQHLPAVRFAVPARDRVLERYAALADRPSYALSEPLPQIAQSRPVPSAAGTEYWLSFASPLGDTAWAHVIEPDGVSDPPSLVWGHGLGVEIESLDGADDGGGAVPRLGLRLVRLEAPWHNRRRLPGSYGGEPFLATQPEGTLVLLGAAVREFAIATAWCRRQGSARVAIGGTSLGAITSQLAASHAPHWPAPARPDALLLVTTTGDVTELGFKSSLARALGVSQALAAAGWTAADLARLRALVDPAEAPPLPPDDIVMLLGRADDVTPFAGGIALARRWRVPAENLFLRPGGHFSVALGLIADKAPFARLAQRLGAGRAAVL